MKHGIIILPLVFAFIQPASAADMFWNGANPAANPANGGTGNWDTTEAWRSGSDTGASATWLPGAGGSDNAYLGGQAGTIRLGTSGSANFTGADLNVATSGYVITSSNGSRDLVFSGTLSLAANTALTLDMANSDPTWEFGAINFGSGSSLLVQGNATANNSNRLNLSAAGSITGGSITLAGSAAGPTGFVSTAAAVILNTDITNNSATSATMLGATDGDSLSYGGVISGSAHLQISAGQNGGAGIITLTNQNTYLGGTWLNTANDGVLRMGVSNALPATTTVHFNQSAGGGSTANANGTLDLNGFGTSVGALDGNGRGIANTGTATVLTIGMESGNHNFEGVIGIPSNTTNLSGANNDISIVKTGNSTQTLAGTNTYTGTTTVQGGTLNVDGSITSAVTVSNAGSKLGGSGAITGNVQINDGAVLSPGNSPGLMTVNGNLDMASGSIFEWELGSETESGRGTNFDAVDVSGSLTVTDAVIRIIVTGLDINSTFWDADHTWNVFNNSASGSFAAFQLYNAATPSSQVTYGSQGSFSFDSASGSLKWQFAAVPELSNVLVGGLLGIGLLRRHRSHACRAE